MNNPWFVASAARVFEVEARAVAALVARLDDNYSEAVRTIIDSTGRVIVCGMGKSGIVGRKIAATLSSTGTPAFFMHPAEAYHGDLGMVQH
ncbi:SIS domain-containing protein, partial [Rhizobium leguminosarum]|nr:SIS domain-containing protein [Rhizobium leguminosarum]